MKKISLFLSSVLLASSLYACNAPENVAEAEMLVKGLTCLDGKTEEASKKAEIKTIIRNINSAITSVKSDPSSDTLSKELNGISEEMKTQAADCK